MITISGLTTRQKTLMELMWQCQTMEQLQTLIKALPTRADQRDAVSLVQIATLEGLEEEGVLDQFEQQARDILVDIAGR
jgi:thioredoxin-like negative regulator of GroEL